MIKISFGKKLFKPLVGKISKYLLEVVSLRDSKTAEAIIVELNVTGL